MLAHSPKDRSRSPQRTNGNQNETSGTTTNNKSKKENESQARMKTLKAFIQTLNNDSSSLSSTSDEQIKSMENACVKEFPDLSAERIRRMIRSIFKIRQTQPTNSFLHQDHSNVPSTTTTDRFNSNENNNKKSRSNSTSTNKSSDLNTSSASTLSALDADFLRHAFSQQFRPSLDLSAYFSAAAAAAASNNSTPSSLFRPDFSPSNFLQSLTAPPPSLASTLVSSHPHTNGSYQRTNDSSTTNVNKSTKQMKLSPVETNSIKVLVNAYREAASYLNRSADELEQLV